MLNALSEIEIRLAQAQMASTIGKRSGQKQADFLRGELDRMADVARKAINKALGVSTPTNRKVG